MQNQDNSQDSNCLYQPSHDNGLLGIPLSGQIKIENVRNLEKKLECRPSKQAIPECNLVRLQGKIGTLSSARQPCKLEQLLELQYYHAKRGTLKDITRFDASCPNDDLQCGYIFHSELQRLLIDRLKQKNRGDAIVTTTEVIYQENVKLRSDLENVSMALSRWKALAHQIRREGVRKPEQVALPVEEVITKINELEDTVRQALKRLIEEQMQREIDLCKYAILLEGLEKRSGFNIEKTKRLEEENERLQRTIEEEVADHKKEVAVWQKALEDQEAAGRDRERERIAEIDALNQRNLQLGGSIEMLQRTIEEKVADHRKEVAAWHKALEDQEAAWRDRERERIVEIDALNQSNLQLGGSIERLEKLLLEKQERIQSLLKSLADCEGKLRVKEQGIEALQKQADEDREKLRDAISDLEKRLSVEIEKSNRRPVLGKQLVQNLYYLRELPPPRMPIYSTTLPKLTASPRPAFSPAQSKILLSAKTVGSELLKRKPAADELAIVVVSGGQLSQEKYHPLSMPSVSPQASGTLAPTLEEIESSEQLIHLFE